MTLPSCLLAVALLQYLAEIGHNTETANFLELLAFTKSGPQSSQNSAYSDTWIQLLRAACFCVSTCHCKGIYILHMNTVDSPVWKVSNQCNKILKKHPFNFLGYFNLRRNTALYPFPFWREQKSKLIPSHSHTNFFCCFLQTGFRHVVQVCLKYTALTNFVGLKLMAILLPRCWDYRCALPCPVQLFFFSTTF